MLLSPSMTSQSIVTPKSGLSSTVGGKVRCSQGVYFAIGAASICPAKILQWLWRTHPDFHQNLFLKIVRNQFADVGASMVFALVAFAVFQKRWRAVTVTLIALNLYELSQALVRTLFWFDFGDSFAYGVGLIFFAVFKVSNFPICIVGRKIFGP